jgi:uncharacterized protein YndB with AHSA1/START domain
MAAAVSAPEVMSAAAPVLASAPANASFVYMTYVATSLDKMWAALTQGAISKVYWAGRMVDSDWQIGSPVLFRRSSNNQPDIVRAKVLAIAPPTSLQMSWTYDLGDGSPQEPASRVTYKLEAATPSNVKFTLTHEPFEPGSEVADGLREGWSAILSSLKTYLETGQALEIAKLWEDQGK